MFRKVTYGLLTATLAVGFVACSTTNQGSTGPASTPVPVTPAMAQVTSTTSQAGSNTALSNSSTLYSGSNTGQPGSGTPPARGSSFQSGNNVIGKVTTINGTALTLQPLQGSQAVTVQLTSTTTVRKQVTGTISDVQPGMTIRALGQESNGILQARQIQLGTNQGPGNPRAAQGGQGRSGQGANSRSGQGPNGRNGQNGTSAVGGTVDSVSGNMITIKLNNGSTAQIQLASNGQIIEEITGSASDIKQGDVIMAFGQRQGSTLTATDVNISNSFSGGNNAAPRVNS